jgi:hypothetical protein
MDRRLLEAQRDADAAAAALDYFQSVLGFSRRQALAMVVEFIVAPSPRIMRMMRELVG